MGAKNPDQSDLRRNSVKEKPRGYQGHVIADPSIAFVLATDLNSE